MSKKLVAFAAMLALAFGITACEKETPSGNASDATKSAGQTASNDAKAAGKVVGNDVKAAGNAVGNAAQATGNWLAGSKDTAVKAAQDKVADLEVKWQTLQDKAAPTPTQPRLICRRPKIRCPRPSPTPRQSSSRPRTQPTTPGRRMSSPRSPPPWISAEAL